MNSLKTAIKLAIKNIRNVFHTSRFLLTVLMFIIANFMYLSQVRDLANRSGYNVNIGFFSFLFTMDTYTIFIFTAIIIYFSNLPFDSYYQIYVITRSGKKLWQISNVIYIFLSSILLTIVCFISAIIILLPYIFISSDWGSFVNAYVNTKSMDLNLDVTMKLITSYSPLKSILIVAFVFIGLNMILGLLNLTLNKINKYYGKIASFIILFKSLFVVEESYEIKYHISPLSWINLNKIDLGYSKFPKLEFIVVALLSLIIGLILVALLQVRKNDELNMGRS